MGTRNLTKVIDKQGVLKVAQYGQWDGYPAGQGVNALNAISLYANEIERGLSRVRWVNQSEIEAVEKSLPDAYFYGTDDSQKFQALYPNFTRDTCANILNVVAWSVGEVTLVDESDFEKDELFCEGVYEVDFQQGLFVSTYGGKTIQYSLKELPSVQQYLADWVVALETEE